MELGEAQRPGVAEEIFQAQRLLKFAEVVEDHPSFGQVPQPSALFHAKTGGEEVLGQS